MSVPELLKRFRISDWKLCIRHSGTGLRGCIQPLVFLLLGLSLAGCTATKEAQLKKVAKDWCMTIRASQVIPVYGQTEDLQPGDVFLVQLPIDKQQQTYTERGFLPLDIHIARLNPDGYKEFYGQSFFDNNCVPNLPRDWTHPSNTNQLPWEPAPHAAFPTYSFSVRRGAGLNLAVPVQGVPVGLSLLGSDAADGTISIKHARTMGVDVLSLYRQVQAWAQTNADFLRYFGTSPEAKKHNYLRVVTRVFATGEMEVNLRASGSQSGGLDAGVPKPVDLLFPELPNVTNRMAETVQKNFTNGWAVLQNLLSEAASNAKDATGKFLPGGSLRLTGASARTVSLKEEFKPPLILGYLGFDVVLYDGGRLGPPVPTYAILSGNYDFKADLYANPFTAIYSQSALLDIYRTLAAATDNPRAAKAAAALDTLTRFVPDTFVTYSIATETPLVIKAKTLTNKELFNSPPTYVDYAQFRTRLSQTIKALQHGLDARSFQLAQDGGEPQSVTAQSELFRQLQATRDKYLVLRDDVSVNNAARRAGTAAAVQYLEFISN